MDFTKENEGSQRTEWSIDQAHSELTFRVRHLMIAHLSGSFKVFEASIMTYGKDFETADIDLWIEADSLHSGDENRDHHLKSADFFDVAHHRQLTFTSSTIGEPDADGNRDLWGELTIKGITKNIKLSVHFGGVTKDLFGLEKAGFSITGAINRHDFGLIWNQVLETGGIMVSEEVKIVCEVQLTNVTGKDRGIKLETTDSKKIVA